MIPAQTLNGSIPAAAPGSRLVALAEPQSAAAEQYRVLYHRLERAGVPRTARVVAITSAGRGEGRTTTAANLALTAAGEGRSVLLVEADLRHPSLGALFGLAPRAGLAEVLEGTAELSQAVARVGPLSLLCAGELHEAAAAQRSARAAAVVDSLRAGYDQVYLDAPPALAFADGDRVVAEADLAVLVVRARVTPRQAVGLALEALGERAVGLVLNDVDPGAMPSGRWLYADETLPVPPRRRARGS
ncbi:MAG TPA: CpsD/CapB family tyrosine-protein kinase [Anaeromyxobacter sp.]|nr:CpsD/CapB family tyrosine-protein kinase [Anaeromyxobacter sp.]